MLDRKSGQGLPAPSAWSKWRMNSEASRIAATQGTTDPEEPATPSPAPTASLLGPRELLQKTVGTSVTGRPLLTAYFIPCSLTASQSFRPTKLVCSIASELTRTVTSSSAKSPRLLFTARRAACLSSSTDRFLAAVLGFCTFVPPLAPWFPDSVAFALRSTWSTTSRRDDRGTRCCEDALVSRRATSLSCPELEEERRSMVTTLVPAPSSLLA
mmetsp:Transcript_12564/g.35039  ORF Transcript_12564/g.35039 Transcript_12564/m.35039 type:complete len:213 (-) Transcript_12564:336-974(-)